ncbi:hypothetical protein ILUMI_06991 [Ignelater luminosus]|uniref:Uncharacterized protein n=1 Tax=Ignelater luminosus TaxID=2038154 RepID=A0A8K0GIH4_IGNLU|nr:hypothetical protein ILUMI_06991 [Ignelater luminosus]
MLDKPIFSLHDDHLDIFLIEKMKTYRFFQYVFLYSAMGCAATMAACPVLSTTAVRPLPEPFPMDMEKHSFLIYIVVFLYQSYAVMLIGISLGCFDGLVLFFNSIASAQLRILREKIMEATNFESLDLENVQIQDLDTIVNNSLKDCVIQHVAIEG